MKRKVLLLGMHGQVGRELQRTLPLLGDLHAVGRAEYDLADAEAVGRLLLSVKPDIIVNAAAYTAVDRAETETEAAFAINASLPAALAAYCASSGTLLVHYSTDYVFDGEKQSAYVESDTPCPISQYGLSKAAGEVAVVQSGCRHLLLRTSWVFSVHGGNFAKTILNLARTKDALSIVADQYGAPTPADIIAIASTHAIHDLIRGRAESGIYHLTASGETSWHGYAQYLVDQARLLGIPLKLTPENISAIPAVEYPLPAKRPGNSRLSTQKFQNTFDLVLPDWQPGIIRMLQELKNI
jgi:dTDP-4-dehydrorhamnose reductase